jgi:ABC-type sugar transport system ATPase subunit
MSCCFQEHAKFPESLRFNIGIGDIEHLKNDEALMAAAKTGGIEYLQEELGGFDRRLNPTEVRDADSKDDDSDTDKGDDSDDNSDADSHKEGGETKADDGKEGGETKEDDAKEGGETKEVDAKEGDKKKEKDIKKRPAASLSRGQWQRIAIGRAFLKTGIQGGVDLCVYDEPTASLDPVAEVCWDAWMANLTAARPNGAHLVLVQDLGAAHHHHLRLAPSRQRPPRRPDRLHGEGGESLTPKPN